MSVIAATKTLFVDLNTCDSRLFIAVVSAQ